MKVAVIDIIDPSSTIRNREVKLFQKICEERNIPFKEFPAQILPVDNWFDKDTVCFVRGAVNKRLGFLDKISHMELLGCTMVNPRHCIDWCNDKFITYLLLERAGLKQPITRLIPSEYDGIIDYVVEDAGLSYPLIMKVLEGSYGLGVVKVADAIGLKSMVQTLYDLYTGKDVIVQEYIEHKEDYRVHVLDNQVIASMRRTPPEGDFRTNVARGGTVEAADLTPVEVAHCIRAAHTLNARWCGVDFIRTVNEPIIIEVNTAPQTEGIELALSGSVEAADRDAPLLTTIIEHFLRIHNDKL